MSDFIEDAIEGAGLSMDISVAIPVDISMDKPDVYACTITSSVNLEQKWHRNIETKPGCGPPSIGNALYYYAERAQEISQYDDILNWSDEEGHDLNNPKTIPEFKKLVQDKTDLRLLLGESLYQTMMAGLEISQAIGNALGR